MLPNLQIEEYHNYRTFPTPIKIPKIEIKTEESYQASKKILPHTPHFNVMQHTIRPITTQLLIQPPSIPPSQSQYSPAPVPMPSDFNLGQIQVLINDKNVDMIECPGEDKFIQVRTNGNIKMTQIKLAKEEIQSIIQQFSSAAKIPVEPGVFKVAVGELIISAVISDFVGSRFIITKISPKLMLYESQSYPY